MPEFEPPAPAEVFVYILLALPLVVKYIALTIPVKFSNNLVLVLMIIQMSNPFL